MGVVGRSTPGGQSSEKGDPQGWSQLRLSAHRPSKVLLVGEHKTLPPSQHSCWGFHLWTPARMTPTCLPQCLSSAFETLRLHLGTLNTGTVLRPISRRCRAPSVNTTQTATHRRTCSRTWYSHTTGCHTTTEKVHATTCNDGDKSRP